MNSDHNDLEKIEDGLSNKLIYRITEKENTKIIIDFSRDKQEFKNFLTVYEILQKINISIPKIYEVNQKQYKIYMQDFGKNRFNKIYNKDNLYKLLKLAVENIIVIQNESNLNNLKNLKEYTFEDLKIELKEFVTYYIPNNKNSNFPTSKFYESWKSIFYSQNYNMKNFVHKDFEFVNLFFLENCESHLQCGIIDFQSAFKGFIGWDLISLLENPRINFTRDYNDKLIEYFYDNTSIIENFNTFLEQYYVLSLARQTRLLGRWRKLLSTNNDNKYLNYLKITKSRTIATLNNIKNYELRSMYEKYLKYKNKVLLKNTIDFFTNIGCDEILINTHYLHNKIKKYLDKNFKKYPIQIIYEKKILGTGGGVKNIFNYTNRKKICVVNSDIFWNNKNKSHIKYFLSNYQDVSHCKMLLSKDINFLGLKKENGDFNLKRNIVINSKNKNLYFLFLNLKN